MTENKGDLISREALREDLRRFFPIEVLEGIEPKTLFAQIMHDIDNAPTVEPICPYLSDDEVKQPCIEGPCVKLKSTQIAWEQGYGCGYHQAKEDAIRRIAEQYSEHNELIPNWLSIADMKGGAE